MIKTIWTLNIGNYAPEITALTYPLIRHWADKIGAEFKIISERRFPEWPVVYEKLQIYDLAEHEDWNIYIDSDAIVFPEMFDITDQLPWNTVCHNGSDMAGNRWRYDRHFRRDGRHISSCNWLTVASEDCIDLWRPLDMTPAEAMNNIFPITDEINNEVFDSSHLVDDYALSRNIAQFGLKFTTVKQICAAREDKANYFWHAYTIGVAEKLRQIKDVLRQMRVESFVKALQLKYQKKEMVAVA